MLRPRMRLEAAANGRLIASRTDGGEAFAIRLRLWLRLQGFHREGRAIVGPDEVVLPDHVRGDLRLNAGWDCFAGHHLLAEDDAGDRFLRRAFGAGASVDEAGIA